MGSTKPVSFPKDPSGAIQHSQPIVTRCSIHQARISVSGFFSFEEKSVCLPVERRPDVPNNAPGANVNLKLLSVSLVAARYLSLSGTSISKPLRSSVDLLVSVPPTTEPPTFPTLTCHSQRLPIHP